MYWPKEGSETYGVIQVKLVKEDIMATYTVRTLQIKHLKVSDVSCRSTINCIWLLFTDHPIFIICRSKRKRMQLLKNWCISIITRTGRTMVRRIIRCRYCISSRNRPQLTRPMPVQSWCTAGMRLY